MLVNEHLEGVNVLVTRPANQSHALIELLNIAGAQAIAFPTIQIVPKTVNRADDTFNVVVWMSANATLHTPDWVWEAVHQRSCKCFGVGQSTKMAIQAKTSQLVLCPEQDANSETLLNLLKAQLIVAKQKFLIIKGIGGREILAEELKSVGAHVETISVYERALAKIDQPALKLAQWASANLAISLATSVNAFENLLKIAPTQYHHQILSNPIICVSPRIKQYLQTLNANNIVLTESPSNESILGAISKVFALC